jgi:hypothetical protein
MGWRVGVQFLAKARFFSSPQSPDQLLAPTQPPIQWVLGALSPEIKWPGWEPDHSPPSSAKVKNGGTISPLPMSSWHRASLIKYRDNFTFFFYLVSWKLVSWFKSWNGWNTDTHTDSIRMESRLTIQISNLVNKINTINYFQFQVKITV